jgi:cytochrome oxidase assembly protein ShyY1
MTAVGIFAGRGDVILAMGLALIVGVWLGWQLKRLHAKFFKSAVK